MQRRNIESCFAELQLSQDADFESVREAYRKLMMEWHPDRYEEGSQARERAHNKTVLINEAYERIQQWIETGRRAPSGVIKPEFPKPPSQTPHQQTTHGVRLIRIYRSSSIRRLVERSRIVVVVFPHGSRAFFDRVFAAIQSFQPPILKLLACGIVEAETNSPVYLEFGVTDSSTVLVFKDGDAVARMTTFQANELQQTISSLAESLPKINPADSDAIGALIGLGESRADAERLCALARGRFPFASTQELIVEMLRIRG